MIATENINAKIVAKWFIENNKDVAFKSFDGHLKLQKLLYYAQAMYLAVFKNALFDEKIEAWRYGPVVRDVYTEYEHNNFVDNFKTSRRLLNEPAIAFDKKVESVLKVVNFIYGSKTGDMLVDLTHSEDPWKSLEHKVKRMENPEIKRETIASYYTALEEIYHSYEDFDFNNQVIEYINNNAFTYNRKETKLSNEEIEFLWKIGESTTRRSFYVYKEDGELVVY